MTHTASAGLLLAPPSARACYVLAHGAGAGMFHPFMDGAAKGLAERGIAMLRYQFPYMERGAKRPDPPELAHATVRAAVAEAARLAPALPLLAGGKTVPQLANSVPSRVDEVAAESDGALPDRPLPWRGMRAPPVQPVPPPPQSGRRTFATMREIALLSVVALRATYRADRGIGSSSNPLAVSRSRENVRSICTVILG